MALKKRKVEAVELKPLMAGIGAAPNSVSPQLAKLRDDGFVKHGKDGYQVTARGVAHHEKTTAAHANETEG
jgi:Mn-dependent DtxR family transcriptional regulator